jgi:hypothetical protein
MNLAIDNFVFKSAFRCLISGPSQAGKTQLLIKILLENDQLIDPKPDRIVYCYSREQPVFEKLKNLNIEFHKGLIDFDSFDPQKNNLLILDDLMEKCESDRSVLNLFMVDSHHANLSVFIISQSLFSKGKYWRSISLNCSYMIIFNNPRDRSQIFHLARQVFPSNPNFLLECFEDSTASKHGYLFLDLTQATDNNMRVQGNILSNRIIYVEKKN